MWLIERWNAQLVRVLVEIHRDPEVIENLHRLVILEVVEYPILVSFLRQKLGDDAGDALAGLLTSSSRLCSNFLTNSVLYKP